MKFMSEDEYKLCQISWSLFQFFFQKQMFHCFKIVRDWPLYRSVFFQPLQGSGPRVFLPHRFDYEDGSHMIYDQAKSVYLFLSMIGYHRCHHLHKKF